MGKFKKQHFVPKFYLRNFTTQKETVFCYDKLKDTYFKTNIQDIAQGKYFHELNHLPGFFEELLSIQENQFSMAYSDLIKLKELNLLPVNLQASIFLFIASQMLRTNEHDKAIDKLAEKGSKNRPLIEKMISTDTESIKKNHLSFFIKVVPYFATILSDKLWVIFENYTHSPLWTSDNPVTLSNSIDYGPFYGNLGLLCRGLEINFPLTPTGCLSSFDPTTHRLRRNDKKMDEDNIKYHNQLQVQKSTRYIFSKTDDFELAERFLSEYPQFRDPRRRRFEIY